MDLQDVDICPKSSNASVDGVEDMLPTQPNLIDHCSVVCAGCGNMRLASVARNTEEALAENDDFASRNIVYLKSLSNYFFGLSVRVDVCSIPLLKPRS